MNAVYYYVYINNDQIYNKYMRLRMEFIRYWIKLGLLINCFLIIEVLAVW
jgi:hypothetical protein